jgi:orotate phosphoribosyltransferase
MRLEMVMEVNEMKKRLADIILEKSFRFSEEPFTLSSGLKSNYYFDCKKTSLDPEGMNLIGNIVFDTLKDSAIDAVGGLSLGADPIANSIALVSFQQGRPINPFIVRKDAKGHGTKSRIEGNVKAGDRVAILDDVVTTGASTITAIEAAREAGLVIDRVIVLVDREEGGTENILKYVARIEPIIRRSEIMKLYRERGSY